MKELIREAMARADAEFANSARHRGGSASSSADAQMSQARTNPRLSKDLVVNGVQRDDGFAKVMDALHTRIKVVGCGGGGTNTLARIMEGELAGDIEVIACNTDAQHLLMIPAPRKILLGKHLTRGLGAGALPQVGEEAAMENQDEIRRALEGSDLVFITAGLGGGTGTGSAPVVAKIAKDVGALTIAICTLPFTVEGRIRMENAEAGLSRLRDVCDTVIVIPNDKLLELAPRLPLNAAFKVADEVLMRSIRGITEMITKPGLVNLDFADLKTVMKGGGVAMIGLGESDTDDRATEATLEAINSPLLDIDISDVTAALINVVGGPDMTIAEAQKVPEEIYNRIDPDARIIWGTSIDPNLEHAMRVMVVMTGVKSKQILGPSKAKLIQKRKEYGIDFVL